MTPRIRQARSDDRGAVAEFATDTFDWGDYVLDALDRWLTDEDGEVRVAVDNADRPIAIARVGLLSPSEAWMQGARVHPEWRRKGIATALGESLMDWARQRGALVARLAVEDWNAMAQAQVEALGMRRVARFARAHRPTSSTDASTEGNGGRRVRSSLHLRAAPTEETEPAFVAWVSSSICRTVRGLFATHWSWRRLTPQDLEEAATRGALWMAAGGWAIGEMGPEAFEVGWCETTRDTAQDMARAFVDLAEDRNAAAVQAMVVATDWMCHAFTESGYDLVGVDIYAIGL